VGTGIPQSSQIIKNRKGSTPMMTAFATRRCPVCYKTGTIMVDEKELFAYLRGEYVQDAFKSLTVPLREQIISGMHPKCWEAVFGQDREETYND
jgi:hypothetical protein